MKRRKPSGEGMGNAWRIAGLIDRDAERRYLRDCVEERRKNFAILHGGILLLMPVLFWTDWERLQPGRGFPESLSFLWIHLAMLLWSAASFLLALLAYRGRADRSRFEKLHMGTAPIFVIGLGTAMAVVNQGNEGLILPYFTGLFAAILFIAEPLAYMISIFGLSGSILALATILLQKSERVAYSNLTNLAVSLLLFILCYAIIQRSRIGMNEMRRALVAQNESLEEAHETLQEMNKLKSSVMQAVTHDLRTPLLSFRHILGFIRDPDDARFNAIRGELSGELEDGLRQAEMVLNNLSVLSSDSWAEGNTTPDLIAMGELFTLMESSFGQTAARKGIELRASCEDDVIVLGNRAMVATVYRNLVSNALKYTAEGGAVELFAEIRADSVLVGVIDTGLGIGPELLARLRSGDWGISTHGTAGEAGTGIGLMVSRNFLGRMGSQLELESAPGKGCRASFALPRFLRKELA